MKRFVMTIALACAVSSSGFAGEIPSVPSSAGEMPTIGSQSQRQIPTVPGQTPTVGSPSPGEIPIGAEAIRTDAFSLLLTLFALAV